MYSKKKGKVTKNHSCIILKAGNHGGWKKCMSVVKVYEKFLVLRGINLTICSLLNGSQLLEKHAFQRIVSFHKDILYFTMASKESIRLQKMLPFMVYTF